MVTDKEVVDIRPVGNEHAVPIEIFLHPTGQKLMVGMGRDAVDRCGIDHRGQRTGLEAFLKRTEELLAEVVLSDDGRRAVLAGHGHAIADIVLQRNGAVLKIDVVRIFALDGDGLGTGHFGLEIRILTEAFPEARPARIAAEVHHRREDPGALCGAGLVGHGLAHLLGIETVEGRGKVDFLRIEGAVGQVGRTVDHVEAVNARNADRLHGLVLDLLDHRSGFSAGVAVVVHDVEDGTDFLLADNVIKLGGIDRFAGVVFEDGDIELDHLAGLLFQTHLRKDLLDFRLNGGVGRDRRSDRALI